MAIYKPSERQIEVLKRAQALGGSFLQGQWPDIHPYTIRDMRHQGWLGRVRKDAPNSTTWMHYFLTLKAIDYLNSEGIMAEKSDKHPSQDTLTTEERQRIEREFEALFERMKQQQKAGQLITISPEEKEIWDLYWKHIGKVI